MKTYIDLTFDPKKHEWRGNGWRHHVLTYTPKGVICSEPECEINKRHDVQKR